MTDDAVLILGGADSGKSGYAEALLRQRAAALGRPPIYLATAEPFDDELRARIAAHRIARGVGWTTVNAPHALAEALAAQPPGAAILLDSLTMWLGNRIAAGDDAEGLMATLLAALDAATGPVVLVSDEVGLGIVPDNALARRFRTALGRLNQAIAARAGTVIAVIAGLPVALKGALPPDPP